MRETPVHSSPMNRRSCLRGDDIEDADYSLWLKHNHPESARDHISSCDTSLATYFAHVEPHPAIEVLEVDEDTPSCSRQTVSAQNNTQTPLSSSSTPHSDSSVSKFLTSPHLSSPDTPSSVVKKSFPRARLLTSATSLAEIEEKERKKQQELKEKERKRTEREEKRKKKEEEMKRKAGQNEQRRKQRRPLAREKDQYGKVHSLNKSKV